MSLEHSQLVPEMLPICPRNAPYLSPTPYILPICLQEAQNAPYLSLKCHQSDIVSAGQMQFLIEAIPEPEN